MSVSTVGVSPPQPPADTGRLAGRIRICPFSPLTGLTGWSRARGVAARERWLNSARNGDLRGRLCNSYVDGRLVAGTRAQVLARSALSHGMCVSKGRGQGCCIVAVRGQGVRRYSGRFLGDGR